MKLLFQKLYAVYCLGRTLSGVVFRTHGANRFFTTASQYGVLVALKETIAAHAKGGNPFLPGFYKAGLSFTAGGLLILLGTWKPKSAFVCSVFAVAVILLVAPTAEEADDSDIKGFVRGSTPCANCGHTWLAHSEGTCSGGTNHHTNIETDDCPDNCTEFVPPEGLRIPDTVELSENDPAAVTRYTPCAYCGHMYLSHVDGVCGAGYKTNSVEYEHETYCSCTTFVVPDGMYMPLYNPR